MNQNDWQSLCTANLGQNISLYPLPPRPLNEVCGDTCTTPCWVWAAQNGAIMFPGWFPGLDGLGLQCPWGSIVLVQARTSSRVREKGFGPSLFESGVLPCLMEEYFPLMLQIIFSSGFLSVCRPTPTSWGCTGLNRRNDFVGEDERSSNVSPFTSTRPTRSL